MYVNGKRLNIFMGILVVVVMLSATLAAAIPAAPALAAGTTTTITVNKYDPYGNLIATQTENYTWLEANLPVQGNGLMECFHQGPTFVADDFESLWDPGETVNVDSRFYGTPKGTDVKDLCEMVGGAGPGDTIQIKASDFRQTCLRRLGPARDPAAVPLAFLL
jgi:hypothetical protein